MPRIRIPVHLRWSDHDEYGHINNVAYARYLEEARVRLFSPSAERETGMEHLLTGTGERPHKMIVASQSIEFLNQMHYSEAPAIVELWIGKIGGSSFEVHAEIVDESGEERIVATRSVTGAVVVDGETMRPIRLTADEREALERWRDEPVTLRRR